MSNYLKKASMTALTAALVLPLGACGINRTLPPPTTAYDYHERHPVALVDEGYSIDVFPSASGRRLDPATQGRVREFVRRYRQLGHGQITMLAPSGSASAASRGSVDALRHALSSNGVSGSLYVGSYPVSDPTLASPIRLSFQGIRAKVAHRCGDWPSDLASASSLEGWQNSTYWNFGCANQQTLAAQIADPRDLASPRGETDSDIEMRMRAISKVRTGVDPTTKWDIKGTNIGGVGGN